ncbi:MAG: type II/IV secretion system ATPase subunit [Nanoarchaeota archaeon]|nr:type II/IV secretion system ATPase subunit [Nanoarchaeota archaeon]
MICEAKKMILSNKTILEVNCKNCVHNSSLSNPNCLLNILKKVKENPGIDELVLRKRFKSLYSKQVVSLLRDLVEKNVISGDPLGDYLRGNTLLESSLIVKKAGNIKKDSYNLAYQKIFSPKIIPSFINLYIDFNKKGKEVEKYIISGATIKILAKPEDNQTTYHVELPETSLPIDDLEAIEKCLNALNKKEIGLDASKDRKKLMKTVKDLLPKEKKGLANIILRNTFGYGAIGVILSDPRIQDVYIDSPGNSPVYVLHQDYGECNTNITLSQEDLKKIATRLRVISGRPFGESNPVIDASLPSFNTRVCGIHPPITFKGMGFAFRKHRVTPWTINKLLKEGLFDEKVAGLLSYLIDSQVSILITGPRGSGKTSLLMALISEVSKKYRMIIIEDTPEIPVKALRKNGYHIQHIKTKPLLGEDSYEKGAQDALRTALRLGESVLVLGEVRGPEAKSLFEAMRVGAAGNVVMGTIHGSSAYDTWDRIVNDLGVPSTSFKATDVVVSVASIQDKEREKRKVTAITEVNKFWTQDPLKEDGFNDLMVLDPKTKKPRLNLKNSDLLKTIASRKGKTENQILKEILNRIKMKKMILDKYLKSGNEKLLEINLSSKINDFMCYIEKRGLDTTYFKKKLDKMS